MPYGLPKGEFIAIVGQVKKAVWAKGRDHIQDENFPSAGLGYVASTQPDYLEVSSSDDQDIEIWCLTIAKKYSSSGKFGSEGERIAGSILRPIESSSQRTITNLKLLGSAISEVSILKEDGTYWDKQFNGRILRHTDMPTNAELNSGEISVCESYLFQRVGFFELRYSTITMTGNFLYVSQTDIGMERVKAGWFKHCHRHLVYII